MKGSSISGHQHIPQNNSRGSIPLKGFTHQGITIQGSHFHEPNGLKTLSNATHAGTHLLHAAPALLLHIRDIHLERSRCPLEAPGSLDLIKDRLHVIHRGDLALFEFEAKYHSLLSMG